MSEKLNKEQVMNVAGGADTGEHPYHYEVVCCAFKCEDCYTDDMNNHKPTCRYETANQPKNHCEMCGKWGYVAKYDKYICHAY